MLHMGDVDEAVVTMIVKIVNWLRMAGVDEAAVSWL